jgi:hypothetical protein
MLSYQAVSRGGRASGELLNPYSFTVVDDSVYVIDFGKYTLETFSKSEFVSETQVPFRISDQRFFKSGNTFYLPYKDPEICVISSDFDNPPQAILGTEKFSSKTKTLTMNSCNVLSFGENLVVVPEALPWVKIVSKDRGIIRTIDLSQSTLYQRNIAFAKSADGLEDSFYVLNSDACIVGDDLLILIPSYDEDYECNRIITVNLVSGQQSKEIMLLQGSSYSSFCSDGSRIYAFNSIEDQIEVYEM